MQASRPESRENSRSPLTRRMSTSSIRSPPPLSLFTESPVQVSTVSQNISTHHYHNIYCVGGIFLELYRKNITSPFARRPVTCMGLVLFLSASKHILHTAVHQVRPFFKLFSCSLSLCLSVSFTFCLSLSLSIYLSIYIPLFYIPLFLTYMSSVLLYRMCALARPVLLSRLLSLISSPKFCHRARRHGPR